MSTIVPPSSLERLWSIPTKMSRDKHNQNNLSAFTPGKKNLMLRYSIDNQQQKSFGGFSFQIFNFLVNKNTKVQAMHTSKVILRK